MLFKVNKKTYVNVSKIVQVTIMASDYSDVWYVNIMLDSGYEVYAEVDTEAEAQVVVNKLNQMMMEVCI